ncbi:GON1-like protein [Mya arenaria]|uniref:GON1-like protein n=1 Tax=Mya arenaria TaxID=6604 RepID=A0ABY7G080_MYAAR|nr:GON1-like protein [Mya arenaria]
MASHFVPSAKRCFSKKGNGRSGPNGRGVPSRADMVSTSARRHGSQVYLTPATRSRILDGAWGFWGAWSECTRMCDGGTNTRKRECNAPSPENGGKPCEGKAHNETTCNDWKCPPLPDHFDVSQCNETTYMCLSQKQCIPATKRCDNVLQCHDGSDEHNFQFEFCEHISLDLDVLDGRDICGIRILIDVQSIEV